MLQRDTLVRRYANAVLSIGKEYDALEEINDNFKTILQLLDGNTELSSLFNVPIVDPKQKKHLIKKIFKGKVHPLVLNLMLVLIKYNRGELLEITIHTYFDLYHIDQGILPVKLQSASKLSEEEKNRIKKPLEKFSSRKVKFEELVLPELIGGFIIEFSNYRLDMSIRKELDNYRKTLRQAAF